MPFKKRCACESLHSKWNCPESDPLTSRVPALVKEKLLDLVGKKDSVHYTKSVPNFCQSCIAKVKEFYLESSTVPEGLAVEDVDSPSNSQPTAEAMETDDTSAVELPASLKKIDLSTCDQPTQIQLAYDLRHLETQKCRRYAIGTSKDKSLDTLLSFDANNCHGENTKIIQAFVSGMANQPRPPMESGAVSHATPYQMCKTVESVLNLSAVNLTLPAQFRENVVLYTLTGSRLALKIMGSGGAHASYQAVKSWLTSLAHQLHQRYQKKTYPHLNIISNSCHFHPCTALKCFPHTFLLVHVL